MPFKPNYRFERVERERLKKAKKEEKLRRQQERASQPGEAAGSTATESAPSEK
jgi:ATP-dependent RNA circularization protein (DNA/RNA ligase family)